MASERRNDEKETHICMSRNSDKMQIFTTEYHIMNKLDRYVEESENWKVVEVGKINGKVVSKIYEAPRNLLLIRKKKRELSEEQRLAAAERLRRYRNQNELHPGDLQDEDEELLDCGVSDDLSDTATTALPPFDKTSDFIEATAKPVESATSPKTSAGFSSTSSAGNDEEPRVYPEKDKTKMKRVDELDR